MLSRFLENYIKYEINKEILKFRAVNIDSMFKLLHEEQDFIIFLFDGVKTDKGELLEDKKEFTKYITNKYPTVIKTVIALCYVEEEDEKLTFKEKVDAVNNLNTVDQLMIFEKITEITFKNGVFSDTKKMNQVIQNISKTYNLK